MFLAINFEYVPFFLHKNDVLPYTGKIKLLDVHLDFHCSIPASMYNTNLNICIYLDLFLF